MCLHKCKLNCLIKKCQEKWENAYMYIYIWQLKFNSFWGPKCASDPQLTECYICKLNQMNEIRPLIFSDKEKENCIVKNGQNLS